MPSFARFSGAPILGVTMDDTRRLSNVLVRHGTIFTHEFMVPLDVVESMRTDTIVLKVDRSAVDGRH